jgi:hypothetical protein
MDINPIKYSLEVCSKPLQNWVRPVIYELSTSLTQNDTPLNCAPTKFDGTGDSLSVTGPDCGPPIS